MKNKLLDWLVIILTVLFAFCALFAIYFLGNKFENRSVAKFKQEEINKQAVLTETFGAWTKQTGNPQKLTERQFWLLKEVNALSPLTATLLEKP